MTDKKDDNIFLKIMSETKRKKRMNKKNIFTIETADYSKKHGEVQPHTEFEKEYKSKTDRLNATQKQVKLMMEQEKKKYPHIENPTYESIKDTIPIGSFLRLVVEKVKQPGLPHPRKELLWRLGGFLSKVNQNPPYIRVINKKAKKTIPFQIGVIKLILIISEGTGEIGQLKKVPDGMAIHGNPTTFFVDYEIKGKLTRRYFRDKHNLSQFHKTKKYKKIMEEKGQ